MFVYAPGWSLAIASFDVIPPQKLLFPRPKNENFPIENCCSLSDFFGVFLFFRPKFCHAVLDSREHQGLPPD